MPQQGGFRQVVVIHDGEEICTKVRDLHCRLNRGWRAESVASILKVNDVKVIDKGRQKVLPDKAITTQSVAEHQGWFRGITIRFSKEFRAVVRRDVLFVCHKGNPS